MASPAAVDVMLSGKLHKWDRLMRIVVTLLSLLAFAGCSKRAETAGGTVATETIAPAAAQPAPTGTEAMTQTVDIEDSRSEAEGAGVTEPPAATSTAVPAPRTTTQPPATTTTTTTRGGAPS